jgi:NADPH2:quinone reductase
VVSIKAAAVNFPDGLIIQNRHQIKATPPFTPGYELAGVVKEVGEGVTGLKPGEHGVAMLKRGGFAEEVAMPAERFWPVPEQLDWAQAAAFPLAYGTSYYALKGRAALQPGETLLVLGAAGGVGIAGVQYGRQLGARVIACASSAEKLETCRRHGAHDLVDYTREDLREAIRRLTGGRGVDVVLDPVGGRYAEPAVRGMAWGGRYLIIGFTDGEIPKIPLNLVLLKSCELQGVLWDSYTHRNPLEGRRYIADMAAMILSGEVAPLVSATYPLARAAEALNHVMSRKVQGKIVLLP